MDKKFEGRCFAFAIGIIDPRVGLEVVDSAMRFISNLPGLIGAHPAQSYTMLAFDTLDNAIKARGIYTETGNEAGEYIMNARIEDDCLWIMAPAYNAREGHVQ